MKNLKYAITLLFVAAFSFITVAQQRKANKDTEAWRYEIEAVQTGTQGTYLIKVWSYSKKPEIAAEQSKKNAIHGVIFKGFPGKAGVPGQNPLTSNSNLEEEKADYFKTFFSDGGKYMKYVYLSNDGAVAAEDRMKIGKEYKIGVIVSVNVAELRKELENSGVIKSLSSGF
ncbi:hypothetical protein [Flavobacterium foetidum]|uniref:hypothetical protein n=1 Tax=Flavobacterium foetidum TaxID=2026681 RepID=UPI001074F390|nr:hypothetical protein [Flavobacterium foetidum]KAF2509118.1 hypothetical protein E0W73_19110 [Flavobacterium foetidum]